MTAAHDTIPCDAPTDWDTLVDDRIRELTRQRDDALRVAISRGETIAMLTKLLAESMVRVAFLEGLRDMNTRVLSRMREALHGTVTP